MMGNLVQLTVGNYIYEQTGFFSSLDIEIPDNSPWDINIGLDGEPIQDIRQVPLFLKVKLKFTPIHQFRPEIQELFGPNSTPESEPAGYGNQRYISLKDDQNGYQGSYDSVPPPTEIAVQNQQSSDIINPVPFDSSVEGFNNSQTIPIRGKINNF